MTSLSPRAPVFCFIPSSIEFMCVLTCLSSNFKRVSSSYTWYAVIINFLKFKSIGGTSLNSSDDGVNGVNCRVLCGTTLVIGDKVVDINVESGFGGTVEFGTSINPFFLVVLFVVDRNVLNPGVGIANPSLSICGVSVFVSVSSSSLNSLLGVAAKGECVTEMNVEVASGVVTPCSTFCQSVVVVSGLVLHAVEEGGGVVESESSSRRLFFLLGEGMYLFGIIYYYIYMDNLPDVIVLHISSYLWVNEVLKFEQGIGRHRVNKKKDLVDRYNREPKYKELTLQKKDREVKYLLYSYYYEDKLYTKVTSWYGTHKIISVVSHKLCNSTVEANLWTVNAFTLHKTSYFQLKKLRNRIPILLQLHL